MVDDLELEAVAALLGERARIRILFGLLDGQAHTATDLARTAGVSAQAASAHLKKLTAGRLLVADRSGRHRLYQIAGADVAHAVEAIAALTPGPARLSRDDPSSFRQARTCFDHLAGRLGVQLCDAFIRGDLLRPAGSLFAVTEKGERWFEAQGVKVTMLTAGRRPLARRCIDWSERRPHLAGALGAALLQRLLGRGWLRLNQRSRVVHQTPEGIRQLGQMTRGLMAKP